jgi:hypothetical protein
MVVCKKRNLLFLHTLLNLLRASCVEHVLRSDMRLMKHMSQVEGSFVGR